MADDDLGRANPPVLKPPTSPEPDVPNARSLPRRWNPNQPVSKPPAPPPHWLGPPVRPPHDADHGKGIYHAADRHTQETIMDAGPAAHIPHPAWGKPSWAPRRQDESNEMDPIMDIAKGAKVAHAPGAASGVAAGGPQQMVRRGLARASVAASAQARGADIGSAVHSAPGIPAAALGVRPRVNVHTEAHDPAGALAPYVAPSPPMPIPNPTAGQVVNKYRPPTSTGGQVVNRYQPPTSTGGQVVNHPLPTPPAPSGQVANSPAIRIAIGAPSASTPPPPSTHGPQGI